MISNLRDVVIVVGLTVLLFLAGLLTGLHLHHRVDLSPPFPLHEFGHSEHPGWSPERVKEAEARFAQMRPQMEEFRRQLTALQENYRQKILTVLTPEQQDKFHQFPDHLDGQPPLTPAPSVGPGINPTPPASPRPPGHEGHFHGMANFLGMVVYKPQLEILTRELNLAPAQQSAIEKLLRDRRQELLNLVDATPPPSLRPLPK